MKSKMTEDVGVIRSSSRRAAISSEEDLPRFKSNKRTERGRKLLKSSEDEVHQVHIPRKQQKSFANNEYDKACEKLQLSAIPEVLPCREKE
jgi:hypothetical protein